MLIGIIEQLFLFLPLCLGIYISFHVLRLTDLTTDGSFVLGAGVFALLFTHEYSLLLSIVCAVFGGVSVGAFVAFIQKDNRINSLIAGVLTLFILQGLNLIVMGKPNISLISVESLSLTQIILSSLFVCSLVFLVLSTSFGTLLRGFGENEFFLKRLGYSTQLLKTLGLMTSNGLAAFSGAISAMAFGYADINMGVGVTLTGIGALMIGLYIINSLFSRQVLWILKDGTGIIIGVFLYFLILNLFLYTGVDPLYLKILMGGILVFFLRLRFLKVGGV